MKNFNTPDPYQFDEFGNLIVPGAETEEQRLAVESAVLYKEGMSPNHPADIATHNAAEGGGEAPIEEEPLEGETQAEETARMERNAESRRRWDERQARERAERTKVFGEEGEDAQEGYEEPVDETNEQEDSRRARRQKERAERNRR